MTTESLQPSECLACGSTSLARRIENQAFEYGSGKSGAKLSASVPMYQCRECGFDFMAEDGARALDDAIRRHLNVLAPEEIVQTRRTWRLSRAAFAELTGFGVASLARWETGQLIQNASADRLLRLCMVPENIERLRIIASQYQRSPAVAQQTKFRTIVAPDAELAKAAVQFDLRIVGPCLNAIPA